MLEFKHCLISRDRLSSAFQKLVIAVLAFVAGTLYLQFPRWYIVSSASTPLRIHEAKSNGVDESLLFLLINRKVNRKRRSSTNVLSKAIPKAPRWKGDVTSHWKKCYADKLATGRLCNNACMRSLRELPSARDLMACYVPRYPNLISSDISLERARQHWYSYGLLAGLNPFCYDKVTNVLSLFPRNAHVFSFMYTLIAREAQLIYVTNHKAASSTLNHAWKRVFNETEGSWNTTVSRSDPKRQGISKHCLTDHERQNLGGRSHTGLLDTDDINNSFVFSIVRHPMEKFISGVKQIKSTEHAKANASYSEATTWKNEHLMSSAFHLLAQTHSSDFMDYDAVIQLEYLSSAFPEMLQHAEGLSSAQRSQLIASVVNQPPVNVKPKSDEAAAALHDATKGRLPGDVFGGDQKAINRFCNMYSWDYICFGYDLPAECGDATSWV